MIKVGLTGGIASGKSLITAYLNKKKIPVHDSDLVVQEMYKKPKQFFVDFLINIGFKNILKGKKIKKKKIREEIFSNDIKKKKLEKYIHSVVKISREKFLHKNNNKKIVFLDIPLLFENKLESTCDFICSTLSPLKKRKKRAMNRKGMNKEILEKILKNQTTDKIRKKKSDFIINTSKTKLKTYLQVDIIIYDILKKNEKK